ncbi:MAG TPA: PAS domain S-box protein, partial [Candidatus Acidoferrales bacterium]|nr:PAS domain S-box protein [Candidatus Acidoferrales bacterium]
MSGERELRQLDEILSRSPLALVVLDRDMRVAYWSGRARELFGYDREQARLEAHFWPPGAERGAPPAFVKTMHRKDGEVRSFRWTTLDVRDDPAHHLVGLVEDITDQVAAQTALIDSEQLFRSLFESNPDTVVLLSPDGRIVDVNAAVSRFGPVTREQLVGMHYSEFIDAEDVERHGGFLARALAGETLSYRSKARTYRGAPIEIAITTVPVFRKGRIAGVFSIVRDETEQRQTHARLERQERQLADSEARLRSLFLHNPDPVVALDLEGTMTDCNEAAERVFGLPRARIVGSRYTDFLPRSRRAELEDAFARVTQGDPASLTFGVINGEGRHIEVDGTIVPQYSQGRIVGIYALFADITERRAAERHAEMQRQRVRDLYYIAASGQRSEVRIQASLVMGAGAFETTTGAVVDTTADPPHVMEVYRAPGTAAVSDEQLISTARAAVAGASGAAVETPHGVATPIVVAGAV